MTPAEPDLSASHSEPVELVRRILAGDPAAEREMVDRYSRGVRFLLLQLTRNPAWADDLYQETFRLALEKVRGGELREPDTGVPTRHAGLRKAVSPHSQILQRPS